MESLWLETLNGNNKYIIGGIYRHPAQNINTFSSIIDKSFEYLSKNGTPCIIPGDFNIDLSKYCVNRDTTEYVNCLLINNFMPMIILPTRIVGTSSTLTDHIYYCEGHNKKIGALNLQVIDFGSKGG